MPRAMKPAPTIPTLIGVPARCNRSSSRSTMNIPPSLLASGRDDVLDFRGQKIRPAAVLVGDDGGLGRPLNAECRIIPSHPTLRSGCIELRDDVNHLGLIDEGQKRICAAFRDEQHAIASSAKLHRDEAHKGW